MIGIYIRGIRHLWRVTDTSLNYVLVRTRDRDWDICKILKTPETHKIGEKMFILNNYYNHNEKGFSNLFGDPEYNKMLSGDDGYRRVMGVSKSNKYDNFSNYNQFFSEIILLPKTFKEDYEVFLKTNSKMVNTIESKYNVSLNSNIAPKILYVYTDGSKNFYQWAINLYYGQGLGLNAIRNIMQWNDHYSQLTKKLKKGTITAYTTRSGIWDLIGELENLRKEKRVSDTINSFNTSQKKLLKNHTMTEAENQVLSRFAKLSEIKKTNFIKKVSTIEDFDELMRQMRHVTSTHFEWSKESFMDYVKNVEGVDHEIVIETDNLILTKVNDFDTVKKLGKTTNWCISKNKSYWNNYIGHKNGKSTQYMLFDFSKKEDDKLSIIGLTTTHNKGITSAHNFVNDNLMGGGKNYLELMNSFLLRFKNKENIYSIMADCGIDITTIMHFDSPLYKWDRNSLMEYLYECVNSENVDIIKGDIDDPNKLVLSVRDENLRYFFGDSYIDNTSSDYWGYQHIIFIDFSKNQFDPNKLQYGIIVSNELNEDYCQGFYNERSISIQDNDFDSKLIEFGMPYDTIRRTDDPHKRLCDAFNKFNLKIVKECVSKEPKRLHTLLREYIDDDSLYEILKNSMIDFSSPEYLNLIYDNGYVISEFMDGMYISDLLSSVFRFVRNIGRGLFNNTLQKPSEEEIDGFYKGTLDNKNLVSYIGHYLMVKSILENEKKDGAPYCDIYYKILNDISTSGLMGSMIDEMLLLMANKMPLYENNVSAQRLINSCVILGGEEVQKKAEELSKTNSYAKKVYDEAMAYKNNSKEPVFVTVGSWMDGEAAF